MDFGAAGNTVNAMDRNKNITEQSEVDAMVKAIEDANTALVKKPSSGGGSSSGDLIIWKELLIFARTQSKDIVFITDDVKADWWESENDLRIFHHKLVAEFEKTGRTIIACESQDFYTAVSDDYGIEKTDAVELALNMTDSDYCANIKDEVFESISDYLGITLLLILVLMQVQTSPSELEALTHMGNGLAVSCLLQIM